MQLNIDVNLVMLLLIGLVNAYTAWLSHRTNKNVAIVEKATNSMKDALVAATAKASLAEGTAVGLAAGRLEGKEIADVIDESMKDMK